MIEWFDLPFVLSCVAAAAGFLYWYRRPQLMPPGPRGLPVLGVIPFLDAYAERKFAKWSLKHGAVMTVRLGRQDWVVLSTYEAIHEAFVKRGESFSGRSSNPVVELVTTGNGLATVDYGIKWKAQRKFGLMTLRGFGMGKRSMEDRVLEEAEYMNEEIRKRMGKPFSLQPIFSNSVSNVVCGVVFGRRFEYDDARFSRLLRIMEKWFNDPKINILIATLVFVPWLRFVPPFVGIMKDLRTDVALMIEVMEGEVKEHQSTFQKNELRDFIDAFLAEMDENKETFTKQQLLYYIRDLFEAGTGTTANTLRWAILCLIHYPETQEKIYEEISATFGPKDPISMSGQSKMPYTAAFIQELHRYRTLVPLSAPHFTSNDTEVAGFRIPKGTEVLPNIWAVHNDPDLWDEPEVFKPERHLDAEGRFVKSNHVIPFSVGPRRCLGEQLAKTEIFCFLASMVRNFRFLPEPGEQLPEIDTGSNGSVFTPYPYNVVAQER